MSAELVTVYLDEEVPPEDYPVDPNVQGYLYTQLFGDLGVYLNAETILSEVVRDTETGNLIIKPLGVYNSRSDYVVSWESPRDRYLLKTIPEGYEERVMTHIKENMDLSRVIKIHRWASKL